MHLNHVSAQVTNIRAVEHAKLVDTIEKIDSRFMTLPTKDMNCLRLGGQLWEPTTIGNRSDRYNSKAEATLKCCSATSNEIPLGHDSNIAHLVGRVLPKVNFLSSKFLKNAYLYPDTC